MFIDYTEKQNVLRQELRSYFGKLLTPEVQDELMRTGESGPAYRPLVRQLGADGWLGIGWPEEFGGQGRSGLEQFVFYEEAMRAGVPVPLLSLNTVGPMLMMVGTEEQKAALLPGIVSGDITVAVGYTEPAAGTDLASLQTRAARDGNSFVINGTKVFTSHAHDADYIWLACRTDPASDRHAGISIILVPTDSVGFSVSPIQTVGGPRTNVTYYDDVRVPVGNLVGEEHAGWRIISAQLAHERAALAAFGGLAYRLWEEVRDWAMKAPDPGGDTRLDLPWVQLELARSWALLEGMKLMNWGLAAGAAKGDLGPAEAAAGKVYGSETVIVVYRCLLAILGSAGYLMAGSPGSVLHGEVERASRAAQINTFAGGVNEALREIVATRGLGMPRPKR